MGLLCWFVICEIVKLQHLATRADVLLFAIVRERLHMKVYASTYAYIEIDMVCT